MKKSNKDMEKTRFYELFCAFQRWAIDLVHLNIIINLENVETTHPKFSYEIRPDTAFFNENTLWAQ